MDVDRDVLLLVSDIGLFWLHPDDNVLSKEQSAQILSGSAVMDDIANYYYWINRDEIWRTRFPYGDIELYSKLVEGKSC